jgi:predicted lipoprotein with Yx(FWY)xxD motif
MHSNRLGLPLAVCAAALASLLVASGCGGAGTPKGPAQGVARASTGARLISRHSEFGRVLYAANGDVVYMFGPDKAGKSTCYGVCATAWPPLLTKGTPTVTGLDAALLGTTKRRDGSLQVTYNHHPLYFYSGDKHGKIMCQHAVMHGGIWLVLKPNGSPSKAKGEMM